MCRGEAVCAVPVSRCLTAALPPPLCPARLTLVQQRGGQLRQRRGGGRCGRGVHRIVAALCGVGVRLGGRLRRRRRRGKVFDALQRQLAGVRHLLAGVLSVCGRVGVGGGEGGHKAGEGGWLLVGALADGMLVTQDGVRRHACVHRRGRTAAISPASLRQPPLQPTCRCSRSGCRHSSVPIAPRASPASCRTLHIGHNGRVDVRCWPASADASRWRRPPCCNLSISCSGGCCRPAPPPPPRLLAATPNACNEPSQHLCAAHIGCSRSSFRMVLRVATAAGSWRCPRQ